MDEVLAELEVFADSWGIQVLVTGDLNTIDLSVAPWAGNIVVDDQGRIAIPQEEEVTDG